MISLIERCECSPTAIVLEKLAAGLNVTLASLFDAATQAPATLTSSASPVARRADQPVWRDPASGYLRRSISPSVLHQPMQIVEIEFPPGQRVAFEAPARELRIYQQIWVLRGKMDITLAGVCHHLSKGDCMAMELDGTIMFHNPTRKTTRYAVIVATKSAPRTR